ncbi:PH domain-containing protein [Streptomyces beihaiensis]|uniref:PH domain-containing protein n=1 Tax=Streptomyces beihaiensis TaxID=2984495 RepID=A0ABT3TWU1_9ACTN|nr:PH domain-containing protein [Streptomyces beihaiensis]MCX3060433.1 PH domain-containing protein [Streptomyces beihaiensis]
METGAAGPTGTAGAAEAAGAEAAGAEGPIRATGESGPPDWVGLPPGLLRLRRLLLVLFLGPLALVVDIPLAVFAGPVWAAFAALPLAGIVWGWRMTGRNWRSWRYAERADDLLISRGVLWREETIVPYGRMQLVEVTSGPLERKYGLASLQLHTAAAATDATIPGLAPAEAERLRDRLTELGEARSAGL